MIFSLISEEKYYGQNTDYNIIENKFNENISISHNTRP